MIDAKCAALFAALVLLAPPASADQDSTYPFDVPRTAEIVATISARCDACAWDVEGREAVTLSVSLDDRYIAHVPLVRSGRADYTVLLGPAAAGRHVVRVSIDREATSRDLRRDDAASVERVQVTPVLEGSLEHTAVSLAPFVYARPNTVGRFTDVPVFMWYEREPTPRGTRYRYSVIFTNEDGGTPTDRLMATWGRTTDIEYLYSVEVDRDGTILADDIQGPNHEILPFRGTREGRHPLLWVSTDNNMVRDIGNTRIRYAPAPIAFPLDGVSREAVMDAHPWMYEVASRELAREGKIVEDAPPGKSVIPDPRRFVYIEACGQLGPAAALAFEVGVRDTWQRSDRGVAEYKIARDGCFRAAVPTPAGVTPSDIRGLRVHAYARRTSTDGQSSEGTIRLDRLNTVFMLDEHYKPGQNLLRWTGPVTITVGGPPFEIPARRN